jgi:site-specific DNA recombinase
MANQQSAALADEADSRRRAVVYLRVSTNKQADKDTDPEGYSLPAQREACYRKAEQLGAEVVDEYMDRGESALPDRRCPQPGPVQRSRVASMLSNRYYLGYVTFNGVEYEGRHQPLITNNLFAEVQEVLRSRRAAGEKTRVHKHYLKGSIFCSGCGSRLCLTKAKGHGGTYFYFFCIGRHERRSDCMQRYIQADVIEEAVAACWKSVRLPQTVQDRIREGLKAEMDRQHEHAGPQLAQAKRRVSELEQERKRLARGVVEGTIPGDLAREEHIRIDRDRTEAERVLETTVVVWERIEHTLNMALSFIGRCDEVYRQGSPRVRRLANQALFEKLLIHGDEVVGAVLKEPWATLVTRDFESSQEPQPEDPGPDFLGRGLRMTSLVPPAGLEPATRCLEGSRSIR